MLWSLFVNSLSQKIYVKEFSVTLYKISQVRNAQFYAGTTQCR